METHNHTQYQCMLCGDDFEPDEMVHMMYCEACHWDLVESIEREEADID